MAIIEVNLSKPEHAPDRVIVREMTESESLAYQSRISAQAQPTTLTQQMALAMMPDPRVLLLESVTTYGQLDYIATATNSPNSAIQYVKSLRMAIGANITANWKNAMRPVAAQYGVVI